MTEIDTYAIRDRATGRVYGWSNTAGAPEAVRQAAAAYQQAITDLDDALVEYELEVATRSSLLRQHNDAVADALRDDKMPPKAKVPSLEEIEVRHCAVIAARETFVAEAAGKVWLFTLGPAGGAPSGGTRVAEVGPIPEVTAPEYLLRINEASGPPGSVTSVHTHPGSEAFYILAGETSQRTPHGVTRIPAGQSMAGHGADVPMQVSSSGSNDLHSLVVFVVDATKPFSSPAKFE